MRCHSREKARCLPSCCPTRVSRNRAGSNPSSRAPAAAGPTGRSLGWEVAAAPARTPERRSRASVLLAQLVRVDLIDIIDGRDGAGGATGTWCGLYGARPRRALHVTPNFGASLVGRLRLGNATL